MGEEIQRVLGAIDALDRKFSSSIAELKNEVTAGQEAASQEVVKIIDKRSYQFQKKGNETQFLFNASVDEHLDSARKELVKVMPGATEEQQTTIKKAVLELDKGSKAIATRQKHIRIADRSELGWNVVAAYESDELADDLEDEKRLFKAEKEAERKQLQKRKRKQNSTTGAKKRATEASGSEMPPGRGGSMGSRPAPSRPRLIGPCWRCGELGHLAISCTKQRPVYPFDQPQVSEAADSVACLIDVSDNKKGGLDPFDHKSVSANVKPLSELCKLAVNLAQAKVFMMA